MARKPATTGRVYALCAPTESVDSICESLAAAGITISEPRTTRRLVEFASVTELPIDPTGPHIASARLTSPERRLDCVLRYGLASSPCPAECHAIEFVPTRGMPQQSGLDGFLYLITTVIHSAGLQPDWMIRSDWGRAPAIAELRLPAPPRYVDLDETYGRKPAGETHSGAPPQCLPGTTLTRRSGTARAIWSELRSWAWSQPALLSCIR